MIKSYLIIAALAVFLFLSSVTFIYYSKYNEQKSLNAAQSLQISGLKKYAEINKAQYRAAINARQQREQSLLESDGRIEELEKLLKNDACSNTRINNSVNKRLRERVNSLRNTPTAAG